MNAAHTISGWSNINYSLCDRTHHKLYSFFFLYLSKQHQSIIQYAWVGRAICINLCLGKHELFQQCGLVVNAHIFVKRLIWCNNK